MEFFFMFIGLGFFLFVMDGIRKDRNVEYERRLSEAREFGYGGLKGHIRHPRNQ